MISVVLPVYNVAPYLPKCLDSILHNTYQELEVICVNDGSTDDSLRILKEYSLADSRIRIISQENQGLSCARNTGLDAAQGEYVAILDSDDWILPFYFEVLLSPLEEQKADLAICSCQKVNPGDPVETKRCEYTVRKIGPGDIYKIFSVTTGERHAVWNRLYRRELIGDLRFDPTKKNEDEEFILELMCRHQEMKQVYVNAPLYVYLQRAGSLSTRQSKEDFLDFTEGYEKYNQKHRDEEFRKQLAMMMVKRALSLRYYFTLRRDRDRVKRCNRILHSYAGRVGRQKAAMLIFSWCPWLYRWFRILTDRSLLEYERQMKSEVCPPR